MVFIFDHMYDGRFLDTSGSNIISLNEINKYNYFYLTRGKGKKQVFKYLYNVMEANLAPVVLYS